MPQFCLFYLGYKKSQLSVSILTMLFFNCKCTYNSCCTTCRMSNFRHCIVSTYNSHFRQIFFYFFFLTCQIRFASFQWLYSYNFFFFVIFTWAFSYGFFRLFSVFLYIFFKFFPRIFMFNIVSWAFFSCYIIMSNYMVFI